MNIKPVPVAAHAQISFPNRATGMVDDWIGVGCSNPKVLIAFN